MQDGNGAAARLSLAFVLAAGLSGCGGRAREVLAHDVEGRRASRAHEVRRDDGGWVRHGPFEAWHPDGTPRARGAFRDGLQDGEWVQWHASGREGSRGVWSAGAKEGPWTYRREDGTLLARGSYARGEPSGPWTHWLPDGSLEARGSYLFGAKEGVWLHRLPDGSVDLERSGVYEGGERIAAYALEGSFAERADGVLEDRVEYADGVPHGVSASWYADGTPRHEGRYERGRKTGRWSYWNPDGSVDSRRTGVYDGRRRIGD